MSKTILLVMAYKRPQLKMLCGVQISSGTYWKYTSESDYILVLRDQLPKTVSFGALSKQKSFC